MLRKLALATTLALATAGSAAATTIDFDATPLGVTTLLTFGDVSITFGGGATFEVTSFSVGPVSGRNLLSYFQTPGPASFNAAFAGGANFVSIDVADFGSDDDEVFLRAYDAFDNLLDSDTFVIPSTLSGGTTLSVSSATSIARVEFNEIGTFAGAVIWDNLTYTSGSAIPEPATWAMMILGFGAVGAGYRRRRMTIA